MLFLAGFLLLVAAMAVSLVRIADAVSKPAKVAVPALRPQAKLNIKGSALSEMKQQLEALFKESRQGIIEQPQIDNLVNVTTDHIVDMAGRGLVSSRHIFAQVQTAAQEHLNHLAREREQEIIRAEAKK